MGHQFCAHRISVHVVELLLKFGSRVNVEVIVAALPESPQPTFPLSKRESQLRPAFAPSAAQRARHPLFENLHNFRRRDVSGFAQQEMDVFGHQDVTDEREAITSSYLFENAHRQIPGAHAAQQGAAMIATEGDEMQIAVACDPPEILGHQGEERLIQDKKPTGSHPRYLNLTIINKYLREVMQTTLTKNVPHPKNEEWPTL